MAQILPQSATTIPAQGSNLPPKSMSRYRNVRKAQEEAFSQQQLERTSSEEDANNTDGSNMQTATPAPPAPVNMSVGRTASRYRRAVIPNPAERTAVSSLPEVPEIPSGQSGERSRYRVARPQDTPSSSASPQSHERRPHTSRHRSPQDSDSSHLQSRQDFEAREQSRGRALRALEQNATTSQPEHVHRRRQRTEQSASRPVISPQQRSKQAQPEAPAPRVFHDAPNFAAPRPEPAKEERVFYDAPNFSAPKPNEVIKEDMTPIKPGGGGIVPQIDAPLSAANAGGRRVAVMLNKREMRFPIDLETTPLQLLRSASNCFSETFDPRNAILNEVFSKANVQRPLRMYEHVRDVLNSWDDDEQHVLQIESCAEDSHNELYPSFAPKEAPTGATWELYHSQKPGKWEKQSISLNAEGQLTWGKINSSKDSSLICHMNDFDIYTVMPKRLKKVKPPKKYCFAIKSQEKSSLFLDTSTFIHFFATSDERIAKSFYRMVQDWRSWYLVDRCGEGKKKKQLPVAAEPAKGPVAKLSAPAPGHSKSSSGDSHYLLGTFNDLGFDPLSYEVSPPKKRRDSASSDTPLGVAFPNAPITKFRGRDFSPRLPHQHRAPPPQMQLEGTTRKTSHGTHMTSDPVRPSSSGSGSSRASGTTKPKPLIDLTPAYVAPKQHQKKGKGYHAEDIRPGNLIEAATTPDNPIVIPASRDWRAQANVAVQHSAAATGLGRAPTVSRQGQRSASAGTSPPAIPEHAPVPPLEPAGFTDHSLLASMMQTGKEGWGAGYVGHGVRRGNTVKVSRGDKPMLDLREQSQFASGSLVQGLERVGHSGKDVQ